MRRARECRGAYAPSRPDDGALALADFSQMSELSEWKTRESLPQGRGNQRWRRVRFPNQSNHACIDANTSAFSFVLRALWAPSPSFRMKALTHLPSCEGPVGAFCLSCGPMPIFFRNGWIDCFRPRNFSMEMLTSRESPGS